MFAKRIKPDVAELEIVYDVEWKTPGCDNNRAKIIGIVDTPDTNLDWKTFKSYLIQNSGNMLLSSDCIRISYIDSDDDLIPIDSEMEFRECLKFSRVRARRGRKIVMKVSMTPSDDVESTEDIDVKNSKPKLFCLKKKYISDKMLKKPTVSFDKACSTPESNNTAEAVPAWFESYMIKFKSDLVQEITAAVVTNVRATLVPRGHHHGGHTRRSVVPEPSTSKSHVHHIIEKRKKKKKMPEEDSSDCTDGLQLQWEEKMEILRHMQKISKREKKFEKKLDAKLEKLETKTKKIMEKKSHGMWGERKGRPLGPGWAPPLTPPNEQVMDAVPVDEYNYVPHVLKGEVITQVWKVVNNGHMSWTDETELRFAWGSKSLVPLTTAVKCPLLQPGDTGRVKVKLQAPMFPGNFESYWHFHHQGRRFGHWLGCGVIVDGDKHSESPPSTSSPMTVQPIIETAVDLTMKCNKYVASLDRASTTDDMKIYNSETSAKPEMENDAPVKMESDSIVTQLDMNSWDSYPPHGSSTVPVADLLNIKETIAQQGLMKSVDSTDTEVKIENVSQGVSSMKISSSRLDDLWKTDRQNDTVKEDIKIERDDQSARSVGDAEYISASDSDNISVISGTISIDTDDLEQSDEFVVIPMQTCFNCEQQLTEALPVPSPITVEIPKTPLEPDVSVHEVQASDNNNNMELKPYPEMPMFLPVLVEAANIAEAKSQESGFSEGENDTERPQTEPRSDDDENTVYVRDAFGNSVPVAKVLRDNHRQNKSSDGSPQSAKVGFTANITIGHNTFGDPNFGQGPNGPRFPFGFAHEAGAPPQCHNPGGSCVFRPQHDCPRTPSAPPPNNSESSCRHPCREPETNPFKEQTQNKGGETFCPNFTSSRKCMFNQRCQHKTEQQHQNTSSSGASWKHSYQNIYTEQPRSCKYSYSFEKKTAKPTASNSSTRRTSPTGDSRDTSPVAAPVQILPETLVTGAVNVANSAINTARSVIDMLIPRHEDVVTGHWEHVPPAIEDSIRKLSEMGFNNRELNIMLLTRHNNDVTRVISELIQ